MPVRCDPPPHMMLDNLRARLAPHGRRLRRIVHQWVGRRGKGGLESLSDSVVSHYIHRSGVLNAEVMIDDIVGVNKVPAAKQEK